MLDLINNFLEVPAPILNGNTTKFYGDAKNGPFQTEYIFNNDLFYSNIL